VGVKNIKKTEANKTTEPLWILTLNMELNVI